MCSTAKESCGVKDQFRGSSTQFVGGTEAEANGPGTDPATSPRLFHPPFRSKSECPVPAFTLMFQVAGRCYMIYTVVREYPAPELVSLTSLVSDASSCSSKRRGRTLLIDRESRTLHNHDLHQFGPTFPVVIPLSHISSSPGARSIDNSASEAVSKHTSA